MLSSGAKEFNLIGFSNISGQLAPDVSALETLPGFKFTVTALSVSHTHQPVSQTFLKPAFSFRSVGKMNS